MYYHFGKQTGKNYMEGYFTTEFSMDSIFNAFSYYYNIDANMKNLCATRGEGVIYYVHDSGKIIRVREEHETGKYLEGLR